MKLSAALKGQLTKALKTLGIDKPVMLEGVQLSRYLVAFGKVRAILIKHVPAEQAKHATKQYLRSHGIHHGHGQEV